MIEHMFDRYEKEAAYSLDTQFGVMGSGGDVEWKSSLYAASEALRKRLRKDPGAYMVTRKEPRQPFGTSTRRIEGLWAWPPPED